MTITKDQIAEHIRLVNALNALDYAPAAHEDNVARLAIVKREVQARQADIQALEKKTKSEYKDFSKAKSSSRQFFLRLKSGEGAVTQLVEKEEKEYYDALRVERDARDELSMLLGEKNERERAHINLSENLAQIGEIKSKMEKLYEGLFKGPTPEYPEEEAAEKRFNVAEATYHLMQKRLNKYSTALTLLVRAETTINTCIAHACEAREATKNISAQDTSEVVHAQLLQATALLSAKIAINFGQNLLRQADEASGGQASRNVGKLDFIPSIPETKQWNGRDFAPWVDPEFPKKLADCIQQLGDRRSKLRHEIDLLYARIEATETAVREATAQIQTSRQELGNIRCQIMMRLTDPAALQARTYASPRNAQEMGDAELPVYFNSTGANGTSTVDPQGNISVGVPSYDQAQAHAKPVGGFRGEFPGGNPVEPAPAYTPTAAPSSGADVGGFRGATSVAVVGGFRGEMQPGPGSGTPILARLTIPEAPTRPSLASPFRAPPSPSPVLPSASTGSVQHRPVSWSLNPYASAMIRKATMDDLQTMPGGWSPVSSNPFVTMGPLFMGEESNNKAAGPSSPRT